MTPDERFREGLALCDCTFRLMQDGIRLQFPLATPQEVVQVLRERLGRVPALSGEALMHKTYRCTY